MIGAVQPAPAALIRAAFDLSNLAAAARNRTRQSNGVIPKGPTPREPLPSFPETGSKTKAGKNRIIPIPCILRPVVEKAMAGRHSGPLIAVEQGGFWRLDNWRPRQFNP